MGLILNIETSGEVCSVALALDGKISTIQENHEGKSHAKVLTTLISQVIQAAGKHLSDLDAIAVSKGPGSFTGLRIGVASAKGLCYALNKPLIGINTLQSMANAFINKYPEYKMSLLCPMIDARRMEVYTALFNADLTFKSETRALIITETSLLELISSNRVVFFGDGSFKCAKFIENQQNALILVDFLPTASGMASIAEKSYNSGDFEDAAYFEPFYLKNFYTPGQPSSDSARQ